MDQAKPDEVIARVVMGRVPDRPYPNPLPDELARWHCYIADGGHSVVVALANHVARDAVPDEDVLVPAPVKSVLKAGWVLADNGMIICNLPYDSELGLITPEEDDEFDTSPTSNTVRTYQVGEPYNPRITSWSESSGELILTAEGAQFLLPMHEPRSHEIKAFQRGTIELGLLPADHFLLLVYNFTDPHDSNPKHGIPWSDAGWEAARQELACPATVSGARGSSVMLQLFLINTRGIIEGMRLISLPPHFSDALRDAVARQKANPDTSGRAMREIRALYQQYTSAQLITECAVRCTIHRS